MSDHYLPAVIMFVLTIAFTAVFWVPALKFKQKNRVVSFYWIGLWVFLSFIAALSGAQSVLIILGQDVARFTGALLTGVTASFVVFVMFAWARLTLMGVSGVLKKVNS